MKRMAGLGLKLNLNDSLTNFEDSMKDLEATYRIEGLSINEEQLRISGQAQEMEVTYADLIIGRRIGQGACSAVHLAEHEKTGKIYAVKMFNTFDKGQRTQMISEVKLLSNIECECIVSIKGAWYHDGSIGLILEYMDWGSLEFLCRPHIKIDEHALGAIVYQVLWGLGYLHFDNRMHRDIKPANVLINSEGEVKLSDFGISTYMGTTKQFKSSSVGTFRYMSPERLLGEEYDKSGDIWSVGIMVTQLWSKIYPFHYGAATPIELLTELESIDIDGYLGDLKFPGLFRQFIMRMLAIDPKKRQSTDDLLRHPWLKQHGITSLQKAQGVVKEWIVGLPEHGAHPSTEISTTSAAGAGFSVERAELKEKEKVKISGFPSTARTRMEAQRQHHSSIDALLSDSHDEDHPLIVTPRLSRTSSTSSSCNVSIQTDISNNNSRNNSRNSSQNNLLSGRNSGSPPFTGAGAANGGSPPLDHLKCMLPSTRPTFNRSVSGDSAEVRAVSEGSPQIAEQITGKVELAEETLELGCGSMTVGGNVTSDTQADSVLLQNDPNDVKKRGRAYESTIESIESTNTIGTAITHSKTRSTANFTTGTVESLAEEITELNFDENEEDMYLKEGFEKHEGSYDGCYGELDLKMDEAGAKEGGHPDPRDNKDARYWDSK